MKAYFSSSKLTFIPDYWRNDGTYSDETWPKDAVLLTQEESDTYWRVSPPEGKQLGASMDGRPAWVDVPPPSHEELISQADATKAALQYEAEVAIKPLERASALGMATQEELDMLAEWEKYSVHVMRVDTSSAPNIEWPKKPS